MRRPIGETITSASAARGIRTLAFAALAASTLVLAIPPQANAFGLEDIFGAIEDVWEKGDNAVNSVGRAAADKAGKVGRGELESTSTAPRPGRTVTGRGNASDSTLPPARGTASSNTSSSGSALPPPRKQNERVVVRVPQPEESHCSSGNCDGHHHGHRHHNRH